MMTDRCWEVTNSGEWTFLLCSIFPKADLSCAMQIGEFTDADLVFEEKALVGGYDVGPDYRVLSHRLVEIMHDASTRHVMKLKLSARELRNVHLTWVLIRQRIQILIYPMMGDKVKVKTYPSGKDRLYTYRDFVVSNQAGEPMATSSSTWLLMDTKQRKLASYPGSISSLLDRSNKFDALPRASKLRSLIGKDVIVNQRMVQSSDLDFNGHLSSPNYYRWMLDVLPPDYYRDHQLQEITVQIQQEGSLSDHIDVVAEHTEQGWNHQMRIGDNIVALGRSIWE